MHKLYLIEQSQTDDVYANKSVICATTQKEALKIRLDSDHCLTDESIKITALGEAYPSVEKGMLTMHVIN